MVMSLFLAVTTITINDSVAFHPHGQLCPAQVQTATE
jgi:hypothetical protein